MRTLPLLFVLSLALVSAASAERPSNPGWTEAPAFLKISEKAKVGYRYQLATNTWLAIVGETKTNWEVEQPGFYTRDGKGRTTEWVMALVVNKKTGRVVGARIGPVGGKLSKLVILLEEAKPPRLSSPKKLKLPSGATVMADVFETEVGGRKVTTWEGHKGTRLEGVLLRRTGLRDVELKADPKPGKLELEDLDERGKTVFLKTLEVSYTDGTRLAHARHPVARALGLTVVERVSTHYTMRLVSLRKDAKKTLNWKWK
ncbi:MAG: hypothetical protein JKY65_17805 [Planctomycetes bacterium]|nr:hypothetical protein [Planctomycetota bacterium]